jgi:hypothetical protein
MSTPTTETHRLLLRAIAGRRLVSFVLDGCLRIGEPHDYGLRKGVPQLFFYQIGGESRSGRPPMWRIALLPKISGLEVLGERFAGSRPTESGRHIRWDTLFASVSRQATILPSAKRAKRPARSVQRTARPRKK